MGWRVDPRDQIHNPTQPIKVDGLTGWQVRNLNLTCGLVGWVRNGLRVGGSIATPTYNANVTFDSSKEKKYKLTIMSLFTLERERATATHTRLLP